MTIQTPAEFISTQYKSAGISIFTRKEVEEMLKNYSIHLLKVWRTQTDQLGKSYWDEIKEEFARSSEEDSGHT